MVFEDLKHVLRSENLSHVERDYAERMLDEVAFNKNIKGAKIIYWNYSSYINNLMDYNTSITFNGRLKQEMDKAFGNLELISKLYSVKSN